MNRPRSFYFLGIGGSAMGQVALLLHKQGHRISGADQAVYPPISHELEKATISYQEGYDIQHLLDFQPDQVVVGNAMGRGNAIVEYLLNHPSYAPIRSLPSLIKEQLINNRKSIIISGTHGKTSTTAATAYLLNALKQDPGYLLGGVPLDLPSGAQLGSLQSPFVIEGDEYDSAFFDKRSKFIHYLPHILVIGNLEFDHADIFRDLEDVQRSFRHLIRLVPSTGAIFFNADEPSLSALLPVPWTQTYSVGLSESAQLQIKDLQENAEGIQFNLYWKKHYWCTLKSHLSGIFNARNLAMAAISSAYLLNPKNPVAIDPSALCLFKGVKRRLEIRFQSKACMVFEDFAHHPTAIAYTLDALRKRYPSHKLLAVFEPRSNTSASCIFQETLPSAFAKADQTWIAPIYRKEQIAPEQRLNVKTLCTSIEALKGKAASAIAFEDYDELLHQLMAIKIKTKNEASQWITVFLSNGNFGGILPRFIEALAND